MVHAPQRCEDRPRNFSTSWLTFERVVRMSSSEFQSAPILISIFARYIKIIGVISNHIRITSRQSRLTRRCPSAANGKRKTAFANFQRCALTRRVAAKLPISIGNVRSLSSTMVFFFFFFQNRIRYRRFCECVTPQSRQ